MNAVRLLRCSCQFAVLVIGTAALAASTPVRIEQTVEAEFPAVLSLSPISSGEARVIINVDDQGKLADFLVASYTDKAFADEAVRALKQWRYEAATSDGKAVGVRMELSFDFSARGRVISLNVIDTMNALLANMGTRALVKKTCRPDELDQSISAVQAVSPPRLARTDIPAAGERSTVLLDFYVDESGQPRMPVVVNSPSVACSQAAVDALSQWRFSTPTSGGRPVAVRARQEFIFTNGS